MTDTQAGLLPCPWCHKPLTHGSRKFNPHARCTTEGCFGAKMPVVNTDQPDEVAAWNTRPSPPADAVERAVDAAMKHFHFPAGDARYQAQASVNMRQAITDAIRQASGAAVQVPEIWHSVSEPPADDTYVTLAIWDRSLESAGLSGEWLIFRAYRLDGEWLDYDEDEVIFANSETDLWQPMPKPPAAPQKQGA